MRSRHGAPLLLRLGFLGLGLLGLGLLGLGLLGLGLLLLGLPGQFALRRRRARARARPGAAAAAAAAAGAAAAAPAVPCPTAGGPRARAPPAATAATAYVALACAALGAASSTTRTTEAWPLLSLKSVLSRARMASSMASWWANSTTPTSAPRPSRSTLKKSFGCRSRTPARTKSFRVCHEVPGGMP